MKKKYSLRREYFAGALFGVANLRILRLAQAAGRRVCLPRCLWLGLGNKPAALSQKRPSARRSAAPIALSSKKALFDPERTSGMPTVANDPKRSLLDAEIAAIDRLSIMIVRLVPATPNDRARIARIRAPIGAGRFVHFNWFWLDRALADPEIQFSLIRGGLRDGITGCLAYGPHERVDLDPSSRMPGVGEIYHIVIDRQHVERGQGTHAILAGIEALRAIIPRLSAVRISHHVDNIAAARLYARLGFVEIGEKIDGETGIRDRLLQYSLTVGAAER